MSYKVNVKKTYQRIREICAESQISEEEINMFLDQVEGDWLTTENLFILSRILKCKMDDLVVFEIIDKEIVMDER